MAISLLTIVVSASVASFAGLSMGLGAFIAGLLLADTEYRHEISSFPLLRASFGLPLRHSSGVQTIPWGEICTDFTGKWALQAFIRAIAHPQLSRHGQKKADRRDLRRIARGAGLWGWVAPF